MITIIIIVVYNHNNIFQYNAWVHIKMAAVRRATGFSAPFIQLTGHFGVMMVSHGQNELDDEVS